jgi:hypothetical protein
VFTPKEIDSFAFSPDFGDEEVPDHVRSWLNPHYYFSNAGDNTSTTDMRKPIKQKTPKAKSKFKIRPKAPGTPVKVTSFAASDTEDDADDEGATGGAVSTLASSWSTDQSLQFCEFAQGGNSLKCVRDDSVPDVAGSLESCAKHEVATVLLQQPKSENEEPEDQRPGDEPSATKPAEWTIILLCTDRNSFLKQCNAYGQQCNIVEITEEDDFTSEQGYHKVATALQNDNCVVFASLPCTGGSPWQIVNKKHPACRRLLKKHHKLFNELFAGLQKLFDEFSPKGSIPIVFEWPRCCRYWKKPMVARFIRKYKLSLAKFDGCAFGLRSCIEREKEKFLKKPWMVATNVPEVFEALNGKLCPGTDPSHQHSTTCGINARHSQYYTKDLAATIHEAIAKHHTVGSPFWIKKALQLP